MADLAQLFTDVQELVIQQEPAVTQIQQGAEETHRNVQQANTKLDSAITSARNARRWKWYALIIVSMWSFNPALFLQLDFSRESPTNLASFQSSSLLSLSVSQSVLPRPTRAPNKRSLWLFSPHVSLPTMYDPYHPVLSNEKPPRLEF